MKIKICGVTLPADAARVAASAVDFIGINLWPKSKRYVTPSHAGVLATAARGAGPAHLVAVFVDPGLDEVAAAMREAAFDAIQLHGDESPDFVAEVARIARRPVWKALAATPEELGALARWPRETVLLLDTPSTERGGTGRVFDWGLARDAACRHPELRFALAGGLAPENVAAAIAAAAPWAVDVASGVEAAPGIKDPTKLAAFIRAARS